MHAPYKSDLKDFGNKKDDAVAQVQQESNNQSVQAPNKPDLEHYENKKDDVVVQVQQELQAQQELHDQSVHFSGKNTTNECNEVPTTHYALTL